MVLLKDFLQEQQLGLTVYSPDCTQSRLWGNLDHAISSATGFKIVRRHWIKHDINSILRFYRGPDDEPAAEQDPAEAVRKYDNIPAEILQPGHLVVKGLMMGPSLVTIWQGEDAIATLLRVKGITQPAESADGTIRGGFWCDNGVCNLVHSSDDTDELSRELAALKLDHCLDEAPKNAPLIDPIPAPTSYVAHSAISIVYDVVNRVVIEQDAAWMAPLLPASGNARDTNQRLTTYLREAAARHPQTAPFIEAFLSGDLVTVTTMLQSLPITRWEHFVIQCGTLNRDRWNAMK